MIPPWQQLSICLLISLVGNAANSQELTYRPGGVIFNKKIVIPNAKPGSARVSGSSILFSSVDGRELRLVTKMSPDELERIAYVVAKNGGIAVTQDHVQVPGDEELREQGFVPTTTIADPSLYGTRILRALDKVDGFGGKLYYGIEYYDGALFFPFTKAPNFVVDMVNSLNNAQDSQVARIGFINEFSGHECNPDVEMGSYSVSIAVNGDVSITGPIIKYSMEPGILAQLGDSVVRSTLSPLFKADECFIAHRALTVFNQKPNSFLRDLPELAIVVEAAKVVGVLLYIQGTQATPGMNKDPKILGGPLTSLNLLNRPDQIMSMCKKIGDSAANKVTAYINEILTAQKSDKRTTIQYDRLLTFLDCIKAFEAKSTLLRSMIELNDATVDKDKKKSVQYDLRYQLSLAQYHLKNYNEAANILDMILDSAPDKVREKRTNELMAKVKQHVETLPKLSQDESAERRSTSQEIAPRAQLSGAGGVGSQLPLTVKSSRSILAAPAANESTIDFARRSPWRRFGYTWVGFAVGFGAGAVTFAALGAHQNATIGAGGFPTGAAIQQAADTGQTYNYAGYGLLGATGVALLVAIPVILTHRDQGDSGRPIQSGSLQ